MFINVVITRVILFCPAVPSSPPSAPSLVPRNATSFVSLLAKLLVLRARLSLSAQKRERGRGRESAAFPHESACSSSRPLSPFVPSTLSFFLFLSLLPSSSGVPLCSPQRCIAIPLFFSLSVSVSLLLLALFAVLSLTGLSTRSHSFSSSPPLRGETLPSVLLLVFRVVLFLFFHPSSYSPAGGSFSTRVRAGVSLPLTATTAVAAASTLLPRRRTASRCSHYFSLFPRPFLSLSIAVFCTLRI